MGDKLKADYYCPKCKHGLLESQAPGDPRRCPKCKGLVTDMSIAHVGDDVPMFEPKLAGRVGIKVGTPQVTFIEGSKTTIAEPKNTPPILPQFNAMRELAQAANAFVLCEKALSRIADALENDGKDPAEVIGAKPSDLHLLGEAFDSIGRFEAARIAYGAEADHSGDPAPVFDDK